MGRGFEARAAHPVQTKSEYPVNIVTLLPHTFFETPGI